MVFDNCIVKFSLAQLLLKCCLLKYGYRCVKKTIFLYFYYLLYLLYFSWSVHVHLSKVSVSFIHEQTKLVYTKCTSGCF